MVNIHKKLFTLCLHCDGKHILVSTKKIHDLSIQNIAGPQFLRLDRRYDNISEERGIVWQKIR